MMSLLYRPLSSLAEPSPEAIKAKDEAEAYIAAQDITKAVEAYERALRFEANYAEVYYALGLIYDLDLGDLKKAVACYEKFLSLSPDSSLAETVSGMLKSAQEALSALSSSSSSSSEEATSPSPTPREENPFSIDKPKPVTEESDFVPAQDQLTPEGESAETLTPAEQEQLVSLPQERELLEQEPKETSLPDDSHSRYVQRYLNNSKVLKYSLKLRVWEKKGFIQKFNELAMARGSSLTSNIAEKRAQLRLERQKVTDFIDYPVEAEDFLLGQMLNELIRERWGLDLPQLPPEIEVDRVVLSRKISDLREDKKYVRLSLEAKVDTKVLEEQLVKQGYQFTPIRVQLQCANMYGDMTELILSAICRKSVYLKGQSEGFYEIYTTTKQFAAEIGKMIIGPYSLHIESIAQNKIAFSVIERKKEE